MCVRMCVEWSVLDTFLCLCLCVCVCVRACVCACVCVCYIMASFGIHLADSFIQSDLTCACGGCMRDNVNPQTLDLLSHALALSHTQFDPSRPRDGRET